MEIRIFKAENNKFNKTFYAVFGAKTEADAINAVIRKKKASTKTFLDYSSCKGVVAPYSKEYDGLWLKHDRKDGKPCIIVWKGQAKDVVI